jgi:hypothetical protein
MAVHLLEAGRGIEYVADHLGHKNIQNTRIYVQITNPLCERVFRELEQHSKIVRLSEQASPRHTLLVDRLPSSHGEMFSGRITTCHGVIFWLGRQPYARSEFGPNTTIAACHPTPQPERASS